MKLKQKGMPLKRSTGHEKGQQGVALCYLYEAEAHKSALSFTW